MSKLPTMPFVVDAYMADTTHLSLEEHGAYMLLLFSMWRRDGFIEDNDKDNARMLGVQPKHWLRLKQRLMPMLTFIGGRITQKKLQIQWNYAQENKIKQSEKGKLGAKARIERNQGLDVIRSLGRSRTPSITPASSPSTNTGQASLSIKDTTTSSSFSRPKEVSNDDAGPIPHHLLRTPLMQRGAA